MMSEKQKSLPYDRLDMNTFLLDEYNALRNEILKRIELQHQMISLTLIVFGTILGFGLQLHSSSIVLLYPVVSFFLAASWAHNGRSIRDIATYIREQVEARAGENNFGWEHRALPHRRLLGRLDTLSARGIFAGTSLLAILVAVPLAKVDTINIFLFAVAIASIIGSTITLRYFRPQRSGPSSSDLKS